MLHCGPSDNFCYLGHTKNPDNDDNDEQEEEQQQKDD